MILEDGSKSSDLLDYFPALVDGELLTELQRVPFGTSDQSILAQQARLSSLIRRKISLLNATGLQVEAPGGTFLERIKAALLRRFRR